jgi:hypothetical protein
MAAANKACTRQRGQLPMIALVGLGTSEGE